MSGRVNTCECSINVVTRNKPKMLRGFTKPQLKLAQRRAPRRRAGIEHARCALRLRRRVRRLCRLRIAASRVEFSELRRRGVEDRYPEVDRTSAHLHQAPPCSAGRRYARGHGGSLRIARKQFASALSRRCTRGVPSTLVVRCAIELTRSIPR